MKNLNLYIFMVVACSAPLYGAESKESMDAKSKDAATIALAKAIYNLEDESEE